MEVGIIINLSIKVATKLFPRSSIKSNLSLNLLTGSVDY
jgi:hypothetical protein